MLKQVLLRNCESALKVELRALWCHRQGSLPVLRATREGFPKEVVFNLRHF